MYNSIPAGEHARGVAAVEHRHGVVDRTIGAPRRREIGARGARRRVLAPSASVIVVATVAGASLELLHAEMASAPEAAVRGGDGGERNQAEREILIAGRFDVQMQK